MNTLLSGTVTFLFSDIEGSTRLWEASPVAMKAVIARHDALAASAIAEHGGALVKSRGEGDSLFAVFARASDDAACSCTLQRAIMAEPRPQSLSLRVRMALHTGEADLTDGDSSAPPSTATPGSAPPLLPRRSVRPLALQPVQNAQSVGIMIL